MKPSFSTSIGRAIELTRGRKLDEATRVIVDLLSGGSRVPSQPGAESSGAGISLARRPHASERGSGSEPAIEGPPSMGTRFEQGRASQASRPLGEVLQLLREGGRLRARPEEAPLASSRRCVPPIADGAAFLAGSFTCAAGTRDYKLYVPSRLADPQPSLLMMLHGCTQSPDDFAIGTKMNLLAEEHGFIVAYPEQPASANTTGCWNWFNPYDQMREAGEPSIIAGLTRQLALEYGIDPQRVFIAGLSAGGAMAEIMGATYPELYAAIGVHSGLPYGSARDVASAFAAMRGGKSTRTQTQTKSRHMKVAGSRVRTIVFHGTADQTVHPANGETIAAAARAGRTESAQTVQKGQFAGREFTRTVIRDVDGREYVEHWAIGGLGHAWSGGSPHGSYTDVHGPDASREMLRFFLEQAESCR